jgi:succinate dehydrogenase / fumarate reductase membrane anchor subunit|tara:strand:+ start:1113 stop:1439 length:327 start_codon:yes stop_codon:yes gene_type:complete
MNFATKKWIILKISSLILIPLMLWFVLNFVSIYDKNFEEVLSFFSNTISKLLFSLFIVFSFFFSALSISEVFEDYIDANNLKNVANRLLYLSAIIIPLITIILIFRLN